MAKSNEEWELSKENIQPLQSGRKHGVLKVALNIHPDDAILQQRQAFEQELRTYSGDDPLSVWCNYIKWVEQNFPKGGRDGHIEQLMQRCLFILKDEKKYYDDKRFIEIWLKYASVTIKPIEVYEYIYSHNIGCKSATFFITWSWELEQQGNLKRAHQILCEGLQRCAEPQEKLKSYYTEFEMRVANKVMTNPEDNIQEENCRSAFSVLKPVKKKSQAPILRTGENVVDPGQPMTIGRQQAIPKKSASSAKVPFKIYNAENVAPNFPVQSENATPFVLYSDQSKENERKPSKWNKVRAKQTSACPSVGSVNPEFKLHCDEAPQPASTPRSVPKVSDVLRVRKGCASPQMALFEPPDPLKMPMYDKNKVYGGAEEFSLEEIKAAAWWKRQKENEKERQLAEQQRLLQEQQECIKNLQQQLEQLQKGSQNLPKATPSLAEKDGEKPSIKKSRIDSSVLSVSDRTKNSFMLENDTVQRELFPCSKVMTTSYNEAANIVQDLYNGTFINPLHEMLNNEYPFSKDMNNFKHHVSDDEPDFLSFGKHKESGSEILLNHQPLLEQHSQTANLQKEALPFAFYRDPTESISRSSSVVENSSSSRQFVTDPCFTNQENVLPNEDAENIPPEGYIQEKSDRELSGILEPSKNIMFVPLELQEIEEEEELNLEEFVYEDNHHIQDDTIIPPCNTEQFLSAAFVASTPRTHLKNTMKAHLQSDVEQEQSFFTSNPHDTSVENCNVAPVSTTTKTTANNEPVCTSAFRAVTNHSIYPLTSLSVIMESSREGYKSSSSSGSSAGSTQLSQFYSHEKSHTYRQISRRDTFKEPLPPTPKEPVPPALKEPLPPTPREPLPPVDNPIRKPIPISMSRKETFSIHIVNADPFDVNHNEKLLLSLFSSSTLNGYINISNQSLKDLKQGKEVLVGDKNYQIVADSFGKVYEAVDSNPTSNSLTSRVAIKLCKYNSEWEIYICAMLHERLQALSTPPDISMSVLRPIVAQRFSDCLVLVHEFCSLGTLFDFVNLYKKKNPCIPELTTMYLTLEMLQIVAKIHDCKIIHGDISLDNILLQDGFLLCDFSTHYPNKTKLLKLIDFSRAIDLNLYRGGACFQTPQYDYCIEMMEGKPWVFQVDWYGVLNCVHELLFGAQMKVKKDRNGKWGIEKKFSRFWELSVWVPLFDELLNIPSSYQQPDIAQHISGIESILKKNIHMLKIEFQHFAQLFPQNK